LTPLNQQIYITQRDRSAMLPFLTLGSMRITATLKWKTQNIPSYGRVKEIAAESRFEFCHL